MSSYSLASHQFVLDGTDLKVKDLSGNHVASFSLDGQTIQVGISSGNLTVETNPQLPVNAYRHFYSTQNSTIKVNTSPSEDMVMFGDATIDEMGVISNKQVGMKLIVSGEYCYISMPQGGTGPLKCLNAIQKERIVIY